MSEKRSTNAGGRARAIVYPSDVVDAILLRIGEGDSLNAICAEEGMPDRRSFYRRLDENPELQAEYNRALSRRAHLFADQIVDLADEEMTMTVTETDDNGVTTTKQVVTTSPEHQARQKLRVDARKWATSKLLPKVYGDKLAIGGADDLAPIKTISATLAPTDAYAAMLTGKVVQATKNDDPEDFM